VACRTTCSDKHTRGEQARTNVREFYGPRKQARSERGVHCNMISCTLVITFKSSDASETRAEGRDALFEEKRKPDNSEGSRSRFLQRPTLSRRATLDYPDNYHGSSWKTVAVRAMVLIRSRHKRALDAPCHPRRFDSLETRRLAIGMACFDIRSGLIACLRPTCSWRRNALNGRVQTGPGVRAQVRS